MRLLTSDIQAGYVFQDIPIDISAERDSKYKEAVNDSCDYRGAIAPLECMGVLLGYLVPLMPERGITIHTQQQMKWLAPVELGKKVNTKTVISSARRRANRTLFSLSTEFFVDDNLVATAVTSLVHIDE